MATKKPNALQRSLRRTTPARRRSPASIVDAIRTVPLHAPKPHYTIHELATQLGSGAPSDPFEGHPHVAASTAKLTYRNGPLLQQPQVFSVYWGSSWNRSASAPALRKKIDVFFQDILVSALLDQLTEYNVAGQKLGHGQYLGSTVRIDSAPKNSVSDSAVRTQLLKWIKSGAVPKNTRDSLYFIYLEPGVVSVLGGSKSCQNFCGYHNAIGKVYYAVMPYPSCAGCLGGLAPFDALTATSSHELCEAITDPIPGTGWYDDANGEIGDICAWNFKKVGSYTAQREWSNKQKRCV